MIIREVLQEGSPKKVIISAGNQFVQSSVTYAMIILDDEMLREMDVTAEFRKGGATDLIAAESCKNGLGV